MLVYVDDFLMCFHETYNISVLKEMFKWGEWTDVRNGIKFKGKELALVQQPNGEYCVKVTQTEFIKNSIVGKLTRERSQGAPALTPAEMTEFRSCSGCLQWLAGQTRPDVAAGVSLANKGTETTTEDLKNLYKLMSYAKATDDVGLLIRPIPLNSETVTSPKRALRLSSRPGRAGPVCAARLENNAHAEFWSALPSWEKCMRPMTL